MQRWPAVPTAPNRTARSARSRLASFITMMALLPPSSSRVRPSLRPTVSATMRPMRHGAGGADERNARIFEQPLADHGILADDQAEHAAPAMALQHAVADLLHRDGGQRRFQRRLPENAIAADRREERIPGPDRDRES